MSMSNQVETLTNDLQEILDFDELESKIYLTLLRTGPITGSALAKELNVDRAVTYRTVDKLVGKNIISTSFSSPKLCMAEEPENAFKFALEQKKGEINKIKKSQNEIIEKISNIRYCPNPGINTPTLRTIQGREYVYADIAQLIENCFETVFIATTVEDVAKMFHTAIPEKIKICEEKGGKVNLLVEIDDTKDISFVKRLGASETRVCKLPSKGRIVVQKEKLLIMSNSSETSGSETDLSISTNAQDMISNIDNLCRLLWKSAKTLDKA